MDAAPAGVDLFVLPEMFTTGFSMRTAELAERSPGETQRWLLEQARARDAAVTGSVMIRDGERCCNRLLFAQPDGTLDFYDTRHLFRMGGEEPHYAAGDRSVIVSFRGIRIGLQVCYDLLLYVANWPAARASAWRTLLAARAIENQAVVAGVNRIGADGNRVAHQGDSVLHDPLGAVLMQAGAASGVFVADLDLDAVQRVRQRFPAHLDADPFTLAR